MNNIAEIVIRRTTMLKDKNNKELKQNIIFATLLSLCLFLLSLFFANSLKKRFLQYQEKVNQKSVSLNDLNANLELLVLTRTTALEVANKDLESTLSHLKSTQSKLLESEKMASMVGWGWFQVWHMNLIPH